MLSCPGRFRTSKKLSSVSVARSFPAHLAAKVREPRRPPGLTLSAASSPSWFANQSAGGRFPQTRSMTRREPARPHSELRSSPGSRKAAHTGSKFSAGSISQLQANCDSIGRPADLADTCANSLETGRGIRRKRAGDWREPTVSRTDDSQRAKTRWPGRRRLLLANGKRSNVRKTLQAKEHPCCAAYASGSNV